MQPAIGPAALFNLGNALFAAGDAATAIEAFRSCIALAPDHAASFFNLGNALVAAGRSVDAVDAYVACLNITPSFGPAYLNLATALHGLALLDQAQAMAAQAVQCLAASPQSLICLAGVLHDQCDFPAAAALYRQALKRLPGHAGALSSLGNSLRTTGQTRNARVAHDQAIAAAPDDPLLRFNRATALLEAGDFEQGWQEYEWRWRLPHFRDRGFGRPWRGEDIAGRTILLHAEQGLGDTIQFVRYASMVAETGARVVLEVQRPLVRLLRSVTGVDQVIARGDRLPGFDTHCPLLSLPLRFGTWLGTIPARIPYLRSVLPVACLPDGLRVGLVWAGAPHADDARSHLVDRRRSIPRPDLAGLGSIPNVTLISLQHDLPGTPDMIEAVLNVEDFAATAAVVSGLDLVISVDTAVAHLAGALGKPVWLLSRYDGCWRWLRDRDDSPWYPSMRIYRQESPLDWSGPIRRVAADLAKLAGVSPTR